MDRSTVVPIRKQSEAEEQLVANAMRRIAYRRKIKEDCLSNAQITAWNAELNAELDEIAKLYGL